LKDQKAVKICIVTFQWANNYGAVLQAFALQYILSQMGHVVSILPLNQERTKGKRWKTFVGRSVWNTYIKWRMKGLVSRFNRFRRGWFNYGELSELSYKQTLESKFDFDAFVVGSDQVWNPSFVTMAEEQPVFFLGFVRPEARKISYAASWGISEITLEESEKLKTYLKRFSAISVREKSGIDIITRMGLTAEWMPDPTLLLDAQQWNDQLRKHWKKRVSRSGDYILQYQLQWETAVDVNVITGICAQKMELSVLKPYPLVSLINIHRNPFLSPEEWVIAIRDAKFIVTNSFHGVVFSIIYHRPFVAIPISGTLKGMNERITSLLSRIGLQDRLIESNDSAKLEVLIDKEIDWRRVDCELFEWRREAETFLKKALV
jgi:hypothetical protein